MICYYNYISLILAALNINTYICVEFIFDDSDSEEAAYVEEMKEFKTYGNDDK